ncbi:MAG: hypothetical protein K2M98_04375, partial [Muribaculum sp.]|nr:hypothetical protein [Muribaculum sp.]
MALYPKELLELLYTFLADGVISDRERAALLKRAKKCGVDPEEFDLYIDSKVQEIEQSKHDEDEDDEDFEDEDYYDDDDDEDDDEDNDDDDDDDDDDDEDDDV